ncbi:sulfite exporter TauE/SafE family protein [Candidatus Fermentibacteria bacterium]|nr:sulfite exporter TauE/SafE family protein [Candidatus Fermentibacteria bacterium]
MSERHLSYLLTIGLIGFVAQFVDGTLGMGYGVFSTTLLMAAGLAPAIASASVHTAETVTTLVSGVAHHRLGNVDRKLVTALVIPGVFGGVAGALFLSNVPGKIVKPWVAGILLVMGIIVIWRFVARGEVDETPSADEKSQIGPNGAGLSRMRLTVVGFVAAALDAFGGGGWGPVTTPTLLLGHNVKPHRVVGSVNMSEFFVTTAITVTFLFSIGPENFDWTIVACMLVGGVIAAPTAAWLCRKLPHKLLGILIGVLLVLTNLRTIILTLR